MGQETERKFLVKGNSWRQAKSATYRQGYLTTNPERTVRVRTAANQGYLTIKGISQGATRLEYEYEIPAQEADEMLDRLCEKPLIEKNRYKLEYGGLIWEIDEFLGENEGLVLAEVELDSEEQAIEKPAWLGQEVTGDPRYFNANLVKYPFREWRK